MRAARTPVAPPLIDAVPIRATIARHRGCLFAELKFVALGLARCPQTPARKPLHHDVCVLSLQLMKSRQQLLALAGAEGCRLAVDQNGPISVAGWHPVILAGSRGARRDGEIMGDDRGISDVGPDQRQNGGLAVLFPQTLAREHRRAVDAGLQGEQ